MTVESESAKDLHTRVADWLNTEGYPLEFSTANIFRQSGFAVRQGTYVRDDKSENPREIDVTASVDLIESRTLIRIYHVVECKWSQDKPWVVFTTDRGISPAACVTQTIASLLGSAILWKEAGLEALHKMSAFATPARSGFNGRQAFSKGTDHFFNSLRSVVNLSKLKAEYYDDEARQSGVLPKNAAVVFPTIVVDGDLFEAFYDESAGKMSLLPVPYIRCHWKGAPDWIYHASVDIVAFAHLEEFARQRHDDVLLLRAVMQKSRDEIAECFQKQSLDNLVVTSGSRGVVGLHRLFHEIKDAVPQNTSSKKRKKG